MHAITTSHIFHPSTWWRDSVEGVRRLAHNRDLMLTMGALLLIIVLAAVIMMLAQSVMSSDPTRIIPPYDYIHWRV